MRIRSSLNIFLVMILVLTFTGGCTKKRSAQLTREQLESSIALSSLYSQSDFSVKITDTELANEKYLYGYSAEDKLALSKKLVDINSVPALYRPLFNNMYLPGKSGSEIRIHLDVRDDLTLAFYRLWNAEEVEHLEKYRRFNISKDKKNNLELIFSIKDVIYIKREIKRDKKGNETLDFDDIPTERKNAEYAIVNFEKASPVFIKEDDFILGNIDAINSLLRVEDNYNAQYLFRTTLTDCPNGMPMAFTGMSSNLYITKFEFKKDVLNIINQKPIIKQDSNTPQDYETLFAYNVIYFKLVTHSDSGQKLLRPGLQKIFLSDEDIKNLKNVKDVYAWVNWVSPIMAKNDQNFVFAHFGSASCFGIPAQTRKVGDIRNEDDAIGVSVEETYESGECFNLLNGYYNRIMSKQGLLHHAQSNFTFVKRYAFKRYKEDIKELKPLFSVPFDVQKKLGFGAFTYTSLERNKNGNQFYEDDKSVASLHDLKDGKGIVYILAGLPSKEKEPEIRKGVIEKTISVIKDANKAFKRAFKGTDFEREKDVVTLKIADLDAEEIATVAPYGVTPFIGKPEMGDLDGHFIYYSDRTFGGKVVGVGYSSSNPISGKIESAQVIMYGGHMKSGIEFLQKWYTSRDNYYTQMKLDSNGVLLDKMIFTDDKKRQIKKEDTTAVPLSGGSEGSKNSSSVDTEVAYSLDTDAFPQSSAGVGAGKQPFNLYSSDRIEKLAYETTNGGKQLLFKFNALLGEKAYLDSNLSMSILSGTVGDNGKVKKDAFYKKQYEFNKKLEDNGYCFYEMGEQVPVKVRTPEDGKNFFASDKKSFIEKVLRQYEVTLAHELEHTWGVRHNFYGKMDPLHFFFDSEDEKQSKSMHSKYSRDYSSIMDYLATDNDTYDGYGPQDVYTLRALYPQVIDTKVDGKDLFISLRDKEEKVKEEEVKKEEKQRVHLLDLLNKTSWKDVSFNGVLKDYLSFYNNSPFMFCTDDDKDSLPFCLPHARGKTPLEIIRNKILDYRSDYEFMNFQNQQSGFYGMEFNAYLSKIYGLFGLMASVMHQYLKYPTEFPEYAVVVNECYQFLQEIIRTPTNNALDRKLSKDGHEGIYVNLDPIKSPVLNTVFKLSDPTRNFEEYTKLEKDYYYYPPYIQNKALLNGSYDVKDKERFSVMGVLFDKLIAIHVLTSAFRENFIGRSGNDRDFMYSFYTYERMCSGDNYEVSSSVILNLIKDILLDEITPAIPVYITNKEAIKKNTLPEYKLLDAPFLKAESNEYMKYYAMSGAMLSLYNHEELEIDSPAMAFTVKKMEKTYSEATNEQKRKEVGVESGHTILVDDSGSTESVYYYANMDHNTLAYEILRKFQTRDYVLASLTDKSDRPFSLDLVRDLLISNAIKDKKLENDQHVDLYGIANKSLEKRMNDEFLPFNVRSIGNILKSKDIEEENIAKISVDKHDIQRNSSAGFLKEIVIDRDKIKNIVKRYYDVIDSVVEKNEAVVKMINEVKANQQRIAHAIENAKKDEGDNVSKVHELNERMKQQENSLLKNSGQDTAAINMFVNLMNYKMVKDPVLYLLLQSISGNIANKQLSMDVENKFDVLMKKLLSDKSIDKSKDGQELLSLKENENQFNDFVNTNMRKDVTEYLIQNYPHATNVLSVLPNPEKLKRQNDRLYRTGIRVMSHFHLLVQPYDYH